MNDTAKDDIIPPGEQLPVLASTGVALQRAEIDLQIATAKAHPRIVKEVVKAIYDLSTIDGATAAKALYALPRAGKPIKGPSIRFAEIVYQNFGNCRAKAWVDRVDRAEKVVVAKAIFQDLQNNTAIEKEETRRIVDKHGKLFSDDMIIVTSKAACAIAQRNAILAGVPEQYYASAIAECERIVAGDVKTLPERRAGAAKAFAVYGIKPEQLAAALGVTDMDATNSEHIVTLQGMYQALRSGEATIEEMFPKDKPAPSDAWKPPQEAADPPPHDAHTGEIIDEHSVIHKIELEVIDNQVENWPSWGKRFLQYINAAPDLAHVDEWTKQNASMLQSMKQDSPRTATLVESGVLKRREALQQK